MLVFMDYYIIFIKKEIINVKYEFWFKKFNIKVIRIYPDKY